MQYRQRPHKGNTAYDYALLKLKDETKCSDFISLRSSVEFKNTNKLAVFGYPDG